MDFHFLLMTFAAPLPNVGVDGLLLVQCTNTLVLYHYSVNPYWDVVTMKAIQLRMARAAVGWGVRELAKKAGVTANTVTRIENGADAKQSTMDRLQEALEAAGVEFIDENGGGPGVRLRKRQPKKN